MTLITLTLLALTIAIAGLSGLVIQLLDDLETRRMREYEARKTVTDHTKGDNT